MKRLRLLYLVPGLLAGIFAALFLMLGMVATFMANGLAGWSMTCLRMSGLERQLRFPFKTSRFF